MLIHKLNIESKTLEGLESKLADYKKSRAALDFKGHQHSVNVSINGCVHIKVTEMDRGYMEVPKKGMDMIVLGAKKIYNAKIQELESLVADSKSRIQKLALDIASK